MNPVQKVVIIGCGQIAGGYDLNALPDTVMSHVKAYKNNLHAEVLGAYDTNLDRAKQFCNTWSVPKAFSSLEAMMTECKPAIASICSPNETHFEILKIVSAFSPKVILCEKPLALTSSHGREMLDTADKKKISLAVNYLRRWDLVLTDLGNKIKKNEFGELKLGRVLYTKGVFHNASHGINLLENWFGKYLDADIQEVREKTKNDCLLDFSLSFKSGSKVYFEALDASNYNHFEIDLHFTKGRVFLPGGGREIHVSRVEKGVLLPQTIQKGTLHRAMQEVVDNVINVALNKDQLKMAPIEALETLETCELVREKAL